MSYTIERIATLIGARRIGSANTKVRWLLTDSRSLCFPEETLFFALRSQRGNGHQYIGDLYQRGVRNFVVSETPDLDRYGGANFLVVPNTLAALQRLAERHREEFTCPVVGITGSNGKTMVKEWLYQLLSGVVVRTADNHGGTFLNVVRSPRSYNSQIGVPLSVWLLNEQTETALFEAGISQPGEMAALADMIQPTVGVLTSLGTAHQEHFRSMDEKCMEKLELMRDTKAAVYPADDDTVSRCMRRMHYQGEKIGWSRYDDKAPFFVVSVTSQLTTLQSPCSTVCYRYKGADGSFTIPFTDEASIDDTITCAATALYLGLTAEELAGRMPLLEPVAMRLEVKEGQRGCTLINDSYNSDVSSLDIALDFMSRRTATAAATDSFSAFSAAAASPLGEAAASPLGAAAGKRHCLILSDIYQSGQNARQLYGDVARLIERRGVDKLIGIGTEITSQQELFNVPEKHFFNTTEAFLDSAVYSQLHDELILLKGARSFGFERISELMEQKVHETILEVNLSALVDNLNYYRSFMQPDTKLVCMIKADAYGAGDIEVAKTLQEHRVDYLAVAVADEGAALRRAGITANIMVMNPEMTAFKTIFDYDLEPEIYSFRLLDAFIRAARKEGITGWPVHIKLDTGMHRLGFDIDTIPELIDRLSHQQAVIPRSVFSHFVGSDSSEFDDFSAEQFRRFDAGSRQLQAAFSHKILRHIDNSAGIEHFPDRQLDMCRLGIGLYGVNPLGGSAAASHPTQIRCVTTLKTTILQLRRVAKGESVGYSRRTVLDRDSLIGVIPIGYADGLNRRLGNRHGYCLVGGQQAPYVGNICMDVAMIDVTGIDCHEGDSVEIFGTNLPVTTLSDELDTIPYEVLTGVSNRVKRVYYQD